LKIGVFDSGVGGLTVLKALSLRLNGHSLCYLGDTARVPYGTKSAATVRQYALEAASFLVTVQQVDMLVVACNTASSVAISAIESRFNIPVIGVIWPGARQAIQTSRCGRIGVVGTEGTIKSGVYRQALQELDPSVYVSSAACPLFVPLAEEGWAHHEVAKLAALEYLSPLIEEKIDTLVLGCTHYPLLKRTLAGVLPESVTLVDSAEVVAVAVERAIGKSIPAGTESELSFFVTDIPDRFKRVGSAFWGSDLEAVQQVTLPRCD